MPLSETQRRAIDRHLEKLDDIKIRRPKGDREKIKAYAESRGMSLNAYINALIDADMNADNSK